jgi:hypothetical protein
MPSMTAREILQAFDRGLEAAAHRAKHEIASQPVQRGTKTLQKTLLDGWTIQIVGNTQIGTLRKTYGRDFAPGYRGNAKLSVLLKKEGFETFGQYIHTHPQKNN